MPPARIDTQSVHVALIPLESGSIQKYPLQVISLTPHNRLKVVERLLEGDHTTSFSFPSYSLFT